MDRLGNSREQGGVSLLCSFAASFLGRCEGYSGAVIPSSIPSASSPALASQTALESSAVTFGERLI
jgi:hypothetical protein